VSEGGTYCDPHLIGGTIMLTSSPCAVSEGGTYCDPHLIGGTVILTSVCKVAEHELSFEQ